MKADYADIVEKIDEKPRWWDSDGTPRYCDPHPSYCPNIYADTVGFFRIQCQHCGHEFLVEMHSDSMRRAVARSKGRPLAPPENWHYGDPPNAGCCPSGPTMNSVPRELVTLWERKTENQPDWEWKVTRTHISIEVDWMDEED